MRGGLRALRLPLAAGPLQVRLCPISTFPLAPRPLQFILMPSVQSPLRLSQTVAVGQLQAMHGAAEQSTPG